MSRQQAHTDIAAYVLGVLDTADNTRFEAHLLDCPHCQLDLLELQDLPGVLDRVGQCWPNPPLPVSRPEVLRRILEQTAQRRRKRRRVARLVAAAAVLLIVAGPLVTVTVLASATPGVPHAVSAPPEVATTRSVPPVSPPGPDIESTAPTTAPGSAESASPATPGGNREPKESPRGSTGSPKLLSQSAGIRARVMVRATAWGSKVDLELRGVTGPLQCQLLSVADDGTVGVVTGWRVPPEGYGVPGSPKPLRVSGGTALSPDRIARFEIRSEDGTLLTAVSP